MISGLTCQQCGGLLMFAGGWDKTLCPLCHGGAADPSLLPEADRMVNRLFSGRLTWFWRLWYALGGH